MKFLTTAALLAALLMPLAGCGGPGADEEGQGTVNEQPGDDPFAGGKNDDIETIDGKAMLEAPKLDINDQQGGGN